MTRPNKIFVLRVLCAVVLVVHGAVVHTLLAELTVALVLYLVGEYVLRLILAEHGRRVEAATLQRIEAQLQYYQYCRPAPTRVQSLRSEREPHEVP